MTPARLVLTPQTDIVDAIDQLIDGKVNSAMVVDEAEKLVGILTDKDCLRLLSHDIYDNQANPARVEDFMSPVSVVVEPEMDIFRSVEQFLRCNFHTLPVVQGKVLLGRISRKDLLEGIQRFLAAKAAYQRRLAQENQRSGRPSSIEEMQKAAAGESRESLARRFTQHR